MNTHHNKAYKQTIFLLVVDGGVPEPTDRLIVLLTVDDDRVMKAMGISIDSGRAYVLIVSIIDDGKCY